MTRYFFHYHDGVEKTVDADGCDFATREELRAEAIRAARELICEGGRVGLIDLSPWIDIEDEHGVVVDTVRFGDAVEIRR